MRYMFFSAIAFNQDIGNWNTANVTDMHGMFYHAAAFNQNLSGWHTFYVTDMSHMFHNASAFANHNLSGWDVDNVTNHTDFCTGSGIGNTAPGSWGGCP
jgi:surface protein